MNGQGRNTPVVVELSAPDIREVVQRRLDFARDLWLELGMPAPPSTSFSNDAWSELEKLADGNVRLALNIATSALRNINRSAHPDGYEIQKSDIQYEPLEWDPYYERPPDQL